VGTDKGDGPPKDKPDDDTEGSLDHEPAVAVEPGPAAPVAAEVAAEVAADDKAHGAKPPLRDSMASFGDAVPVTFPDDGEVSRLLRKVDHGVGMAEQAVLFGLLAVVVLTGAWAGISEKLLDKTVAAANFIIPTGVLAIALIGAAFASHQQRHLAMDLVSRRLPPRGRLILRMFLAAVTILVVAIMLTSFWRDFKQLSGEHNANNPLPEWLAPLMLPLGAALIIFHTLVHLVIDADYLVRGKLPPERARSAH
jgi:TRAP-type C4-dicarboxylate transport system permease small subunit